MLHKLCTGKEDTFPKMLHTKCQLRGCFTASAHFCVTGKLDKLEIKSEIKIQNISKSLIRNSAKLFI